MVFDIEKWDKEGRQKLTIVDTIELLAILNFKLYKDEGKYKLKDLQGGNLANIESFEFNNTEEIID